MCGVGIFLTCTYAASPRVERRDRHADMTDHVPAFIRPGAFAATELLLDLFHLTTSYFKLDLEAVWILAVIGHETMRPWILNPATAQRHLTDERVPDQVRGSISRVMVADRTGLPRETVRRRIAELEKKGLIARDERGYVRLHGKSIVDPAYQKSVVDIYRAVERYQKRITAFSVKPGD